MSRSDDFNPINHDSLPRDAVFTRDPPPHLSPDLPQAPSRPHSKIEDHDKVKAFASALRVLSAEMVEKAQSGHPGLPLGMADVVAHLAVNHLRFAPEKPDWAGRDRFIFSAGHGSALLYAMLHLTGYEAMTRAELERFRQLGSKTPGHPEYDAAEGASGIEATTGPLGQGLANGVGMAIAAKWIFNQFPDLDPRLLPKIWVLVGDGCLMEGVAQEAMALAGHLKLDNLIVLFDNNDVTIDGRASTVRTEEFDKRYSSIGWDVRALNGHDHDAIARALGDLEPNGAPIMLACRTTIGFGAPTKADSSAAHGAPLGSEELAGLKQSLTNHLLSWDTPFEVPGVVSDLKHHFRQNGESHRQAWEYELGVFDYRREAPIGAALQYWLDMTNVKTSTLEHVDLDQMLGDLLEEFAETQPKKATRQTSMMTINHVLRTVPNIFGGSADLTASNLSRGQKQELVFDKEGNVNTKGNYVNFGVREHAMASILNGMHLFGFRAYGATFLVFSDYCRPAIRLSALMKLGVIYVMTHDSIGVGEDGPTHQPVEQLAALRSIPGLQVFRPADAAEAAEAWHYGLVHHDTPVVLALTRQAVPYLRGQVPSKAYQSSPGQSQLNLSAKGGYVIWESNNTGAQALCLIASGSEVELAIKTAENIVAQRDLTVRVVSVPNRTLLLSQPEPFQKTLFQADAAVVIEASRDEGWWRLLAAQGFSTKNALVFGMEGFGVSAPGSAAFNHFGFAVDNLTAETLRLIQPR
ncbi:MAG: transketolase [Alphaproteobacteria bacterium]|nr:transketolase [Alphaproteobacteria bacterium]